tara:strand:+ start:333 stop:677 length:345 start_codon:yes stop_codon:yes gene_type:complete
MATGKVIVLLTGRNWLGAHREIHVNGEEAHEAVKDFFSREQFEGTIFEYKTHETVSPIPTATLDQALENYRERRQAQVNVNAANEARDEALLAQQAAEKRAAELEAKLAAFEAA